MDIVASATRKRAIDEIVTPRIRCARCVPVIHRRCHVIYLRVAFYHVILCISFCMRVRLMHPSIFPIVRFAIRHSYALRRPPFVSHCEWVLNVLGMDRVLPSGLGIPPVDHRSSFVPFEGRLVLQRLTGHPQSPFDCPAETPSKTSPKSLQVISML